MIKAMEQMILAAKPHDLTPDIGKYGEWESTWISKEGWTNTFRSDTPEMAVKMAYEALKGSK